MDRSYGPKKYAADKIALLGLFIVALLIARLIVIWRSAIVLSEPIELEHSGLSISIPAGNGWQSEKQWKYRKNTFTLSSNFYPGLPRPTARVRCRYPLATAVPNVRLEQKASALGGTITKTGQAQADTLTVDWAHITRDSNPETQSPRLEVFFGTVQLPNNRQLDIEVHNLTESTDLIEQVFKRTAESLKFKDNHLLKAGSEIVAKIKNTGINHFLNNQNRQAFFLIKEARKHTIGFMMDVLIDSGQNNQSNIQAESFYYARGRHAQERAAFFQSKNNLDGFAWKSETISAVGRSGTEIVLDEAGVMTVRKLSARVEEKKCRLNTAAIPEVFLEFVFSQMLDSSHKKIIVDVIDSDGQITPTLIFRIDAGETGYVLGVEFSDGKGFSEQVYLDSQRQISKILVQQESIYIIERTSIENILRQFPERADYISQKNKILEQDQLP